ncbi:MAG: hypothetical protein Q8Q85_09855 [Gemmatimonadales bacterium]|nr:hypothetical protein [Gemmatimonadales bacterium]
MAGDLPARRIARDALERIIQRAAELQAGEMDTGDEMTEAELLKLGGEVGIDGRFLRQALYEQSAGGSAEKGFLARWLGPRLVSAGRVVPGDKATVEAALNHWMAEGEAMAIKRRLPDRTVWERQKGFFAEMKRGLGVGGKNYHLARALDVAVGVAQLEDGYCHVALTADLSAMRSRAAGAGLTAAGALGVVGVGTIWLLTITGGVPALIALVAAVPLAAGAASPVLAARMQKSRNARMQLALEQVLDRLEHGEIKPRHRGPAPSPFVRVAFEIRKAIAEVSESTRQQGRLPPST